MLFDQLPDYILKHIDQYNCFHPCSVQIPCTCNGMKRHFKKYMHLMRSKDKEIISRELAELNSIDIPALDTLTKTSFCKPETKIIIKR